MFRIQIDDQDAAQAPAAPLTLTVLHEDVEVEAILGSDVPTMLRELADHIESGLIEGLL